MARECASTTFTSIDSTVSETPSAFSMSCMVFRDNNNQQRTIDWGDNLIELERGGNRDWGLIYYNGGAYNAIDSPANSLGGDQWYVLSVSAADGDQEIYKDGASDGTGANSGAASYIDSNMSAPQDVSGRDFNQKIAEVALWNRRLSDAEHAILGARYSPLFIPEGLIYYTPLIRDAHEIVGGRSLTDNGTTYADHPPGIIYPALTPVMFAPAAAATATPHGVFGLPLQGPFAGPFG